MSKTTKPKVIFIMGPGHCGSTLLDLIMGSHSQSFSLGEFSRIRGSIDSLSEDSQICGVCEGHCPYWNDKIKVSVLKLFYSRSNWLNSLTSKAIRHLFNPYKLLIKWSGKNVLIDSSKRTDSIKRQLRLSYRWIGIQPYLIYMVRDGRAVVSSYKRKYNDQDLSQLTSHWKHNTIEMNHFYENFSPKRRTVVRYEELATHPEAVVKTLCQFLGLDYEPEMLQYWASDHHHLFGNGGTRALIYRFREQQRQASQEMRERAERAKQHYVYDYYDQIDIGIKLDERWRTEMSESDLSIFEEIAGDLNRSIPSNSQ